ncbi:MAG TPA: Clp protease ClpP [Rhodospirillales bacterium]|nr:Clp protease ClpP [Rhodospirillales bacterium]
MPAQRDVADQVPGIRVHARSDGTFELLLYGDIGFEVEARRIVEEIGNADGPITVRINSYGGDLADGIAIHNALRRHADVTVVIDGVAASAASVIAMAGARIEMAENATLMIHGPRTVSMGDSGAMRDAADSLDRMAEAMARIYASRPRVSYEQALEWLRDGSDHWFSASEALAIGLVDAVVEASREAARFLQPVKEWLEMVKRKQQPEAATQAAEPVENGAATAPPEESVRADRAAPKPERQHAEASTQQRQADVVSVEFLRQRNAEIRRISAAFMGRQQVRDLVDRALDDPSVKLEDFRARLLEVLTDDPDQQPLCGMPVPETRARRDERGLQVDEDEGEKLRKGVLAWIAIKAGVEQLVTKAGIRENELDPGEFRGMTMVELARELLERAGMRTRGMSKSELVSQALRQRRIFAAITQSTSDFAVLLEDAMHKTLLGAYRTQRITWPEWARRGTVSDFRSHGRYRTGLFPRLDRLQEAGLISYKAVPDGEKATIRADEYGIRVALPRTALVNDDLGVFNDIGVQLGRAARRSEEIDAIALLTSNPTMPDGNPLFDAAHGNVGTAAAPSVASFDEVRQLMASQMDPSGEDYLDLRPAVWLGPIGKLGDAQVVNDAAYDPDTPNKLQRPNKVRGMFARMIGTPRLSGTAWYALADPADAPVIEVAFLEGENEPRIEQQAPWETSGIEWRVLHAYGVAAIDWRGAVRNPGA